MKYGTRYCCLPADAASCWNFSANASNCLDRRLVHPPQHLGVGMFGSDLQQAARVMPSDLADIFGALHRQVHADARGHQRLLHARLQPRGFEQPQERSVIGRQERADFRAKAACPPAFFPCFRPRTVHLIHIGRRAAEVADRAGEVGLLGHAANLCENRGLATALDDAALVDGDRAKRAAAETAAHDLDRVLHDLEVPGFSYRRSSDAAAA